MDIRDVTAKSSFGIVVSEQSNVLELPPEDVSNEDDALRCGLR